MVWRAPLGANYSPGEGGTDFLVWAPVRNEVAVKIVQPEERIVLMEPGRFGYYQAFAGGVKPGTRYFYLLDGKVARPDPASRFQPEGVHGPSEVVDPDGFKWNDAAWENIPLRDYIIHELHTGTFTREGTFEAITGQIPYLKDLGVTAVELMPVAQFPGGRNWGYDGAYPYAPQNTYGGPRGLKKLVDALHQNGLAAILDVVYNHLGPEGNYLHDYGFYFTNKYSTPWGDAINYDDAWSDEVRRFFIENALYWIAEYHFDGLRLDAVHGICDLSPRHFLDELTDRIRQFKAKGLLQKPVYVFVESDRNDSRVIRPRPWGGYGVDCHWDDDFHHAIHAVLTGERDGYYEDFGSVAQIEKSFREGFVYTGQYSSYRRRSHGSPSEDLEPERFAAFSQNHDQVGNRPLGERLSMKLPPEKLKLAAAAVLLGPYVPLLFMGEEYGETAPFLYFVSHSDPALVQAVREGRKREFAGFSRVADPPDPQSEKTFEDSRLNRTALLNEAPHKEILEFYKKLISLRKGLSPALRRDILVWREKDVIMLFRKAEGAVLCAFNFSAEPVRVEIPEGPWEALLGSHEPGKNFLHLTPWDAILLRKS